MFPNRQKHNRLVAPRTFAVFAAHDDDVEMGPGATVGKWIAAGSQGFVLIATSGDKGGRRNQLTSEELVALRQKEQLAAAKVLGIKQVEFLGIPDASLSHMPVDQLDRLQLSIVRWIRTWQPEAILTHDPDARFLIWDETIDRGEVNHPDHRTLGAVVLDAIPSARGRLFYTELLDEGLKPHAVSDVLLWDTNDPNHFEWLDACHVQQQIEAVACHQSQFPKMEPVGRWLCDWHRTVARKEWWWRRQSTLADCFKHVDLRPVF